MMKKILMSLALVGFALVTNANEVVTATIHDGVESPNVKAKMEQQKFTLFTEANATYEAQQAMNHAAVLDSHRRLILNYLEQLRTCYNQKDSSHLESILSDDMLIISKQERKTADGVDKKTVVYTKREYLDRWKTLFSKTQQIRVTYDEIEIMPLHPMKADIYSVTLHQTIQTDSYHNDYYLFLLWDFQDETKPRILELRTF